MATDCKMSYIDENGNPITDRIHYDLRAFHSDNIVMSRSLLDLNYYNATSFNGITMGELDNPRIVSVHTITPRTMTELDLLDQGELDASTVGELSLRTEVTGNENWPVDAAVVFGADATARYMNTIKVTLVSGVTKSVESTFTDNILSGLDEPGRSYFITLELPGWTRGANQISLTESFIDFSSSNTYDAAVTDSIPFSASLNDLSTAGDKTFKINRNSLTHVDLRGVVHVRFRLKSVGAYTFVARAMRVIDDLYTFDKIDIDTKRNRWSLSVPQGGATIPASPTHAWYYSDDVRPKNFSYIMRFNSGHNPPGGQFNTIALAGRRDIIANRNVEGRLAAGNAATTLTVRDQTTVLQTTTGGALTPDQDYFLVLEAYEKLVRATVYKAFGPFFDDIFLQTPWVTVDFAHTQRGFLGWHFDPYEADFTVDYTITGDTEFARFESKPFQRLTPIIGANLAATASPPINLLSGQFIPRGDATVTKQPAFGNPAPSIKIQRTGASWEGGLQSDKFILFDQPHYIRIEGDIYPASGVGQTALRGQYRFALADKYDSIGYIGVLRGLLPNQWNHFVIHMNTAFAPNYYRVILHQIGFFADSFYIDNLEINRLTTAWQISPDNGTSWFPLGTVHNGQFNGVNFIDIPGQQLKIRGIALTDQAWISEYELIPHKRGSYPLGSH
jgi:hypothetical protein